MKAEKLTEMEFRYCESVIFRLVDAGLLSRKKFEKIRENIKELKEENRSEGRIQNSEFRI